ncbi:MAG: RidA family protein [Candidatus Eremiobacterota bacterium]
MEFRHVSTDNAPAAIGPYSQAVVAGNFVFCSGQIPINPVTGEMINKGIAEATEQVLKNLTALLEDSGSSIGNIVKVTVYLTDMNNFKEMNDVYEKYFSSSKPARVCVEVSGLPKGAIVEADAIAILNRA